MLAMLTVSKVSTVQTWMCDVRKCWRSVSYKHLGLVLLASEDGQEQDR